MKRSLAIASLALAACGGTYEEEPAIDSVEAELTSCTPVTRNPWYAPIVDPGTVSVTNDETDLIVTITGENNFLVDEWHVYAGAGSLLPRNRHGGESPGRFLHQGDESPNSAEVEVRIPLETLGDVTCGGTLKLAVHSVMVRPGRRALRLPTLWNGAFNYTVCCVDDPPPAGADCVRPPFYFAQVPAAWPAALASVDLGSASYTQAEATAALGLDWFELGGDISVYLAQNVIAARLNEGAGATVPPAVADALVLADEWFDAQADADGRVPYSVNKDSPEGLLTEPFKEIIADYNRGLGGVATCN